MEYFSLLDFRGRLRVVTTARLRSSTPQGDAEGESHGCWSLEQVVITWSCTRWNEKDTLDILRLSLVNVSSDNCQNRTWFLERLRKLNGDNRRQHDYLFNVLSPCTTKNKLPYHIIRLSILNALRMRNGENFDNYWKKGLFDFQMDGQCIRSPSLVPEQVQHRGEPIQQTIRNSRWLWLHRLLRPLRKWFQNALT